MPGHNAHKIIGLIVAGISGYLILNYLNIVDVFGFGIGLAAAFLFSFLPDIDSAASKARTLFWFVLLGVMVYAAFLKNYLVISFAAGIGFFILFSKHRGMFHSVFMPFVLGLPLLIYNQPLAYVMAIISYLSHIIVDELTTKFKRTFS